jgi:two-component system sensor histidine kinase CpxA
MAQQVESLLLNQKRLLGDISHELRSPLTRLQLAIGIAQQQADVEPSQSTNKQLERIEKESQRMEQMIAQVLTLSRLEAQRSPPENSTVFLGELLQALIKDAQFEAQIVGKEVNLNCAADICLQGEPQLLSSALENILRNGVKYASHRVEVCVEQLNDRVSIAISDDGQGLPEQDLEKVFTPFYRVSAARERDSGGVGLGLAIAQRAIYSHGGKISAENQKAGGLRIRIELAIAQA